MSLPKLRIAPSGRRQGRVFEVTLWGYMVAYSLWDYGSQDTNNRPIFVTFGGTEQETTAFLANARTGRKIEVLDHRHHNHDRMEFLRTAPHRWIRQRLPGGGLLVTGYLPELFDLEPERHGDQARFVFAPPTWWVDREVPKTDAEQPQEVRRLSVLASYFAAYLDRRVAVPVINDPRFHVRLFLAAREKDWFHRPSGAHFRPGPIYAWPDPPVGLETVAAVDVPLVELEALIQYESRRFLEDLRPGDLLDAPAFEEAPPADDPPPTAAPSPAAHKQTADRPPATAPPPHRPNAPTPAPTPSVPGDRAATQLTLF